MKRIWSEWGTLVLWAACLLGGLAATVAVLRHAGERQLHEDAEHTALQYAHFVASTVPDLDGIFAGHGVSRDAVAQMRLLRHAGDVFRFKLFDRTGRLLLTSDDLDGDFTAVLAPRETIAQHHGRSTEVQTLVLEGRNHVALKSGAGRPDRPPVYSEAYVPVLRGEKVIGVVEVYVDQTGRESSIQAAFARVAAAVTGVLLLVGLLGSAHWLHRVRAQRRAEERMRYLSEHDVLSGALNRNSFDQALKQAVWRRDPAGPTFAVLCVDLDGFKDVNDTHGHATGDEVLRQTAQRLREVVRHGDLIARLGGDEFAILQHGVQSPADVVTLAQRMVERLAAPHDVDGRNVHCGASVGAAIFGSDAHERAELMHRADLALYRAKRNGRGQFSFYDGALDQQLQARRTLAHDLREALGTPALLLHYQPLYDADGLALTGYEALLRWNHPTRGPVSPAEFIPLAEDTGLIEPLGRWVLQQACMQAAAWPHPLSVAVNLSAAQFRNDDLVRIVREALQAAGLSAQRLELEITESLLINNTEQVLATLKELSAMGVRIAMDDFGTGYSSLAYLWRFPFDKVKIDRAFTQGLGDDPKVDHIVRSIISLAHSLQIRVNAEGVETAAQMRRLQRHGCDELQGFLLGRPAPAAQLTHDRAARELPCRPPAKTPGWAALLSRPAPL
jgi:diguanylate cyclase (GGDEF)-like protein